MKRATSGWINGFVGVVIFAGSLPATRVAVLDFGPVFLTSARASIAAILALVILWLCRQSLPKRSSIVGLVITSAGVVLGFPFFTALALQHITAAHSIVYLGLLPLCTAIFAVVRAGERPKAGFWVFSLLGAMCVTGYAGLTSSGVSIDGDVMMLVAVVVCGLGYAEGAMLSRHLGGWQVISWALLLALPIMLPITVLNIPASLSSIALPAWLGLAYVSMFSMLLGFVFWYRGLEQGGIAAVGQLQLLQPFMGLGLAAWLLHETVSYLMILATVGAMLSVAGAKRYA